MLMRALRFLNIAVLSVLVGSAALVYSQDEKQQDDKKQEEPKAQPKEEAKPAKPAQEMNGEKRDEKAPMESRDNARPEERKQENMDTHGEKQAQEHTEMRNAHPAGKGERIPDDKFHAHFGQGHHFNVRTVITQGQNHFSYGGYSFQFVDAWPVGWAYTDDCYIDYIDGEYFLIDLTHPGVRLALIVSL
jgi:hypothetical protein